MELAEPQLHVGMCGVAQFPRCLCTKRFASLRCSRATITTSCRPAFTPGTTSFCPHHWTRVCVCGTSRHVFLLNNSAFLSYCGSRRFMRRAAAAASTGPAGEVQPRFSALQSCFCVTLCSASLLTCSAQATLLSNMYAGFCCGGPKL